MDAAPAQLRAGSGPRSRDRLLQFVFCLSAFVLIATVLLWLSNLFYPWSLTWNASSHSEVHITGGGESLEVSIENHGPARSFFDGSSFIELSRRRYNSFFPDLNANVWKWSDATGLYFEQTQSRYPNGAISGSLYGLLKVSYLASGLSSLLIALLSLRSVRKRKRRRFSGFCMVCDYDLRQSQDRCPECGTPIPAIT